MYSANNVARLRKWLTEGVDLCEIERRFDVEDHLPRRAEPIVDCTDAPEHLPAA